LQSFKGQQLLSGKFLSASASWLTFFAENPDAPVAGMQLHFRFAI
jgi:hypothetical protein